MKKSLGISFLLFFSIFIQAQDLFVKQTNSNSAPPQGRANVELLSDGGSISATNYLNGKFNKSLIVHRYSACGDVLWSKSIKHNENLNLADMQIDSFGNTLLVGYLEIDTTKHTPFLICISIDGSIIFFKRYNVNPSLEHIAYSIGVSPNNEYFIYINYDIIRGGADSKVSLLKLDHLGNVKWYRIYNYSTGFYGFMIATSDNGALLSMGIDLIKFDSAGVIEWITKYGGRDLTNLIETNGGYAFNYLEQGNKNPHILCLNKDGSFNWDIKDFNLINGWKGIARKNGNLLFLGNVKQSASDIGLLELNSSDGQMINYKSIELTGSRVDDLVEDANGNVFFSGIKNNQIVLAKLNDTLSTLSCNAKKLNINYSFDTLVQTTINTVGSTLHQVSVLDEAFIETDVNASTSTICSYYENPNAPDLGNDTIICPGTTLTLGEPNSSFAAYKWSTGESSKTIDVTSAGQYILNALSACDTLRDTINVGHYSRIQPQFDFSPTQVMTNDSIRFRNLTVNSFNAKWDFGNGQQFYADSIDYSYEISGNYKVTLTIESSDGCLFSADNDITILPSNYHIPNVFSPNNDGVNEEFKPVGEDIDNFDLSIYNRWGGEVFSSTKISWNGYTKGGEKAESGNYFYKIKVYFNNGNEIEKSGTITLLR